MTTFVAHLLAEASISLSSLQSFTIGIATTAAIVIAVFNIQVDEQSTTDYGLRDAWRTAKTLRDQVAKAGVADGVVVEPPQFMFPD